jgi:hypothetical protein
VHFFCHGKLLKEYHFVEFSLNKPIKNPSAVFFLYFTFILHFRIMNCELWQALGQKTMRLRGLRIVAAAYRRSGVLPIRKSLFVIYN